MKALVILTAGLLLAVAAGAETRRPSIFVRPEAMVRGDVVHLKDIATFANALPEFTELIQSLKNVKITEAPAPKTRTVVPGVKILELIEGAGIGQEAFGYSIPRAVTIEREGRLVTADEVLEKLKSKIWRDSELDVQPREVSWIHDQVIPAGATRVEVEAMGKPSAGKMPVRVEVYVDEKPAARFLATAVVDDWREVPVVKRALERGMLVASEDVELVRLNLNQQPADTISDVTEVVGRRAKGRIDAGETVRKSLVDIPPVITKGRKVVLVYRVGQLTATASGIALEDGYEGGKVRVRNESSKKTVAGRVLSTEEVEVSPES